MKSIKFVTSLTISRFADLSMSRFVDLLIGSLAHWLII